LTRRVGPSFKTMHEIIPRTEYISIPSHRERKLGLDRTSSMFQVLNTMYKLQI
jgi:hypothetical protein